MRLATMSNWNKRIAIFALLLSTACINKQRNKDKRITVLRFEDNTKTKIRKKIVADLKTEFVLVPKKDVSRALRKLKKKKISERKKLAKVAKKLNLDAFIVGKARKKKTYSKLTLIVLKGRDGKQKDRFKTKIKTKRLTSKKQKSIVALLSKSLNELFDNERKSTSSKHKKSHSSSKEEGSKAPSIDIQEDAEEETRPETKKGSESKKDVSKKKDTDVLEKDEEFEVEFLFDEAGQAIDDDMPDEP